MQGIDRRRVGEDLYITLGGRLDEHFDPGQVGPGIKRVILHMAEVTSMNSVGTRALERFLDTMGESEVTLIHVSPAVALQLNLIPALTRHARVQSVKLPFLCPKCGAEKQHSVPWRADGHRKYPPKCSCGTVMGLDGIPHHYLPSEEQQL